MDECTGCWLFEGEIGGGDCCLDRCLEDLALLFKDVILCCRFKTWSDMDSEYSLVLCLELAGTVNAKHTL